MTTSTARANRYAANCVDCGRRVLAGRGLLVRQPSGGWDVRHGDGACPTEATPAEVPSIGQTCEPGVYVLPDGTIVKVQANKAKTNVYAKTWVEITGLRVVDATDERVHGEWDYRPGLIRAVRPEFRMTLDEAKAFILRYGQCVRCGRRLKAAESVERGIGPVCVRYFTFGNEAPAAVAAEAAPAVCLRHGHDLAPACWECAAERDGAQLEADQERAAFTAKMDRDERLARLDAALAGL